MPQFIFMQNYFFKLLKKVIRMLRLLMVFPLIVKEILSSKKINHITPLWIFRAYKELYISTKGYNEILPNLLLPKLRLEHNSNYCKVLEDLDNNGFSFLSKSFYFETKKFMASACSIPFASRVSKDVITLEDIRATASLLCGRYDAASQDLFNNIHFANIVTSPGITDLASLLGPYTVITSALMWVSFHCSEFSERSKSSQVYHVDFDFLSDIKVFILLSDTSMLNGPLEYIIGTHKPINHHIFSLSGMKDDIVHSKYKPHHFRFFTGSVGEAYISNNRGIHRDYPPLPGNYKIGLQINFSRSRFGSEEVYLPSRPLLLDNHSSYLVWQKAIKEHPLLYSLLFKNHATCFNYL